MSLPPHSWVFKATVGYSHFDLPEQVHHLLRRMLLPSCHRPLLLRPVSIIQTGTEKTGHFNGLWDSQQCSGTILHSQGIDTASRGNGTGGCGTGQQAVSGPAEGLAADVNIVGGIGQTTCVRQSG